MSTASLGKAEVVSSILTGSTIFQSLSCPPLLEGGTGTSPGHHGGGIPVAVNGDRRKLKRDALPPVYANRGNHRRLTASEVRIR